MDMNSTSALKFERIKVRLNIRKWRKVIVIENMIRPFVVILPAQVATNDLFQDVGYVNSFVGSKLHWPFPREIAQGR